MDPFGVALGVISLLSVTWNFFISTAEKQSKKYREWKGINTRLKAYHLRYETCMERWKFWNRSWCSDARENSALMDFWGAQGLNGVQRRINNFSEQAAEMRIALEKTGTRDGTETITSPTTRALFALVRSAELKDRITRLIEIIGDLQEYSDLKWLERHGSQYSNSQDNLWEIEAQHQRQRGFATWMAKLYQQRLSLQNTWSLMLQRPEDNGKETLVPTEMDQSVNFLIEREVLSNKWAAHIGKLTYIQFLGYTWHNQN